ncbi:hypothetical protein H7R52_14905 [Weissella confusa]|uniref:Beta-xylosidase C-terminal Concanavalin A-like domain-containing protein n=1 Tax=Weissella confusa TaxID=1583 RepID=A0A923NIT4_WEICO|nr:hypothetical protein [Weissella confusa]
MAGLTNYYNHSHWSWIFITKNDEGQSVIEVAENKGGQRNGTYTSYLKDDAIVIPEGTEYVWFETDAKLDMNWNTLRVPFSEEFGSTGDGSLKLIGRGSLVNYHDLSLIARRWQAFYFDAETKVKFNPFS